jgi:hypothetical protein
MALWWPGPWGPPNGPAPVQAESPHQAAMLEADAESKKRRTRKTTPEPES